MAVSQGAGAGVGTKRKPSRWWLATNVSTMRTVEAGGGLDGRLFCEEVCSERAEI